MSNKKEIRVTNFSDKDIKNTLDFVKGVIKSNLWEAIYNRTYFYDGNTQEFFDRITIRYNKYTVCYLWKDVELTREILIHFLIDAGIVKLKCQIKKKY